MRLFTVILLFIISGAASKLSAQPSRKVDSLLNLASTGHDTVKILALANLSAHYRLSDTALCTKYFKEAMDIAQRSGDKKKIGWLCHTRGVHLLYNYPGQLDNAIAFFHKGRELYEAEGDWKNAGIAYKSIGLGHSYKKKYDEAFTWQDKAYELFKKHGYKGGMGEIESARGRIYEAQGKLKEATDKYYAALKIYESTDNQAEIGTLHIVIGNTLLRQQLYDEALQNYENALAITLRQKNKINSAGCYINIGNVYYFKKKYDDAIFFYMESLKIREELNDKQGIANLNTNIGSIRLQQGKAVEAEEYFGKAEKAFQEMGDKYGKAVLHINIGEMYTGRKEYDKAISYFERSEEELKKLGDAERLKECYTVMAKAYEAKGDARKALDYHKILSALKDSLYTEANSRVVQEMNTKYETEKKESEIALLKEEDEKKRAIIEKDRAIFFGVSGGMILLLALTGVVMYSYRQNKKANIQLAQQNQVIQAKNKDITDSINYAKRIQEAMLPSSKRMKHLLPESFVFYQPKDIISGDFYWCAEKEGSVYIAAADCTGHGVPGALMSMIGINFLDHIVNRQNITDTSEILGQLHKSVLNALNEDMSLRQSKDGMDIALLRIDREQRTIQFSGAVRPLYFVQDNEIRIIKGDRFSIGGILDTEGGTFASHSISYTSPASFYMFSDGYIDQFGGKEGKKFMARSFQRLLLSVHPLPAEEQMSIIRNEINSWKGSLEQIDDMLVVGVKV